MLKYISGEIRHSVRWMRVDNVKQFGFTDRQARFLVQVLVFSGVFLERQYCAFMGLVHGQKSHDFLTSLVKRGFATAITPGALHRGRFYHLHYKPLYEAVHEPDNRHRRPASLGRVVERLMLLDAVLAEPRYQWLGTERDKRAYFKASADYPIPDHWYPHLTFRSGGAQTMRFFPEKLPIGVPRERGNRHMFLYLATREIPMDFRVFLLNHADLLTVTREWTVRVLLPRRFRKAAALYRYAVRDTFLMPLESRQTRELSWYFRVRNGEALCPIRDRRTRRPDGGPDVRCRAVRGAAPGVDATGRRCPPHANAQPARTDAARRRPRRIRAAHPPVPAAHAAPRHRRRT